MANEFKYRIFHNDLRETVTYQEYLDNFSHLTWDRNLVRLHDGRPFILGRDLFFFTPEYLEDHPDKAEKVQSLMWWYKHCPIAYYAPNNQAMLDFLNDEENDVLAMVAPNRVGKTCVAFIRLILDMIPCDPDWPIFTQYGVRFREYEGEKKAGVATYKWQLQKNKIWPDLQRWIPDSELGPYAKNFGRGQKKISWDRDQRLPLKSGSTIQFYVYEQDQDIFESDAMHHFLWDEQGKEVLFDGIDERLRTLKGTHYFALTPHKVQGRPDTGAGSWIHKMITGEQLKGHDIGEYSCPISEVQDWIYPESEKHKAYNKWITEPTKNGNIKVLREGKSRFYGEWHTSSGLIYDEWDRSVHLIDPEVFEEALKACPDMTRYRGLDHGTVNPTACAYMAIDHHGNIFLYDVYYKRGMTIYENVRNIIEQSGNSLREFDTYEDHKSGQIFKRFEEVQKVPFQKSVLDGRSFKQTEASSGRDIGWLYKAAGIHVQPASGKYAKDSIPYVKALLREDPDRSHIVTGKKGAPRLYVVNTTRMAPFIREIESYIPNISKSRWDDKDPDESPRSKDDHILDSLRYAIQIPLKYLGNVRGRRQDGSLVRYQKRTQPQHKGNKFTGY